MDGLRREGGQPALARSGLLYRPQRQTVSVSIRPHGIFQRELDTRGTCSSKLQVETTSIWPQPPCSQFRGPVHTAGQVSEASHGDGAHLCHRHPVFSQLGTRRTLPSWEVTVFARDLRPALGQPQATPRMAARRPPAHTGQGRATPPSHLTAITERDPLSAPTA